MRMHGQNSSLYLRYELCLNSARKAKINLTNQLHKALFLWKLIVAHLVKKIPTFYSTEGSSPYLQEPASRPYPGADLIL